MGARGRCGDAGATGWVEAWEAGGPAEPGGGVGAADAASEEGEVRAVRWRWLGARGRGGRVEVAAAEVREVWGRRGDCMWR